MSIADFTTIRKEKTLAWLKIAVAAAVFFAFFGIIKTANAASIYFSPSSGVHKLGQTFTVGIYVSSADQAMNAVSANISVDGDAIEITGISKGGLMNLWSREPSFSAKSASFEGVIFNPGYIGSGGQVGSLTVRARAVGAGSIRFASGMVLANDGQGTNITKGYGNASFTIKEEEPGAPGAPVITSSTHPDSAVWYQNNAPVFAWRIPSDVTGVSLTADHDPTTKPRTVADNLLTTMSYAKIDDGVWYFHVSLQNKKGWGLTGSFKFQIDSKPPEIISLVFPNGEVSTGSIPIVMFDAVDGGSGIDHFTISMDNEGAFTVKPEEVAGKKPYLLPEQQIGKHSFTLRAYDKAGNVTTLAKEFTILTSTEPRQFCSQYAYVIIALIGLILILLVIIAYLLHQLVKARDKKKRRFWFW